MTAGRRRLSSWRLAALSFVGTLVVVELAFRAFTSEAEWVYLGREVFPDNPRGYFADRGDGTFGLQTDRRALGCDAAARPGDRQVLVVGDSFTYGQGVRVEDVFTSRLQLPGVQVHNCARPGNNLTEIVASSEAARQSHPDALVYAMVLNDVWCDAMSRPTEAVAPPEALQESTAIINDYMNFRAKNFDLFLATESDKLGAWRFLLSSRTFDWFYRRWLMKGIAERTDAMYRDCLSSRNSALKTSLDAIAAMKALAPRFLVVLFPVFVDLDAYPFEAEHASLTRELRARGVNVLDLLDVFRGLDAGALAVHATDLHPNELAHGLAAVAVAGALAPLLEGHRD